MTDPKVSIVIVSWNTRDILLDCLRSIREQTAASHEVIVVDNASADGTVEAIRDSYPDTRIIANETNRGFAAANNQGAEIASGEFLLLLNPDTVILENAIDRCLDRMATWREERIGVLGCQVWETPERIQKTCFVFPGPKAILTGYFRLDLILRLLPSVEDSEYSTWDRTTDRDVDVVSGMFMLMAREILDEDGLFDEQFFIYAEEADLCFRLSRRGFVRRFWTGAKILHLDGGSKSTDQIRPKMYVQLLDSILRFIRKNRGTIAYWVSRITLTLAMTVRILIVGVLAVVRGRDADRKRFAVWGSGLRWLLGGRRP